MNYLQYFHQILYREIIENLIEFCNSYRKSRMIFIIDIKERNLNEDIFDIVVSEFNER